MVILVVAMRQALGARESAHSETDSDTDGAVVSATTAGDVEAEIAGEETVCAFARATISSGTLPWERAVSLDGGSACVLFVPDFCSEMISGVSVGGSIEDCGSAGDISSAIGGVTFLTGTVVVWA